MPVGSRPTLHTLLTEATARLVRSGIAASEAARDAEVLARQVLGCDRAAIITNAHQAVPDADLVACEALVDRRALREPLHQILGRREFWDLEFEITRDVLVPRPETEHLVEAALSIGTSRPPAWIADVGTGSGCLAIVLARRFPAARVVATDVSEAALQVARRNTRRHGVACRVHLVQTPFLHGIDTMFELIVSNPPYVEEGALSDLPPEVRDHEPRAALLGGPDGLDAYRVLVPEAAAKLQPHGAFIVEVGAGQADAVTRLAGPVRQLRVERAIMDLQGLPRVVVFRATG